MIPSEMEIKRENNLCYTSDEKFTQNHRCPNKYMFLLQAHDFENQTINLDFPLGVK